jgi:hypothetical protein
MWHSDIQCFLHLINTNIKGYRIPKEVFDRTLDLTQKRIVELAPNNDIKIVIGLLGGLI